MKKVVFILCLILFFMDGIVYAHPGRTDARGCHTCRKNCASWGLSTGQYHCHNSGSSSSNSNSGSTNTNNSSNVYVKSSVATLSTVLIDQENILVSEEMDYVTTNAMPKITAKPTSSKATVKIAQEDALNHGDNLITITVTAENGTTKIYKLNIKLVNNDTTLKSIKIDDQERNVKDEMKYVTNKDTITIQTSANDDNATILVDESYSLEVGNNKIVILVEAEDEITKKEYILNVTRELVLSDNTNISMTINGEKVTFKNYKSEKINFSSSVEELDIEYELEDKNAKIDLNYDKKLEAGDRTIIFEVIAENGKKQKYTLQIYKNTKQDEVVGTVVGCGILGGIAIAVYKFLKK